MKITLPEPITREEQFLYGIAQAVLEGGSGADAHPLTPEELDELINILNTNVEEV